MLKTLRQSSFKITEPIMSNSFKKDILKILIFAISLLILKLDFTSITNNIELTIIAFAKTMLANKDYALLQLRGVYYLDEGPLVVWLHVLVLKLFGDNLTMHRVFTGSFAILGSGIIHYLVSIKISLRISWITIILWFTCPLFFILSGMVNSDVILAISTLQFLLSFWIIVSGKNNIDKSIYWIMAISFIITFLISGLFSITYLFITMMINYIFNSCDFTRLKNIPRLIFLMILLLCSLWLICASLDSSEFLYEFLMFQYWKELTFFNLDVLIGLLLFVCLFVMSGFPWGILFFIAVVDALKNKKSFDSDQKYLISIMLTGLLIFCHLKIHELVIVLVILFAAFILLAKFIDAYRFQRVGLYIKRAIGQIIIGTIAINILLIGFVLIQDNIIWFHKICFTLGILIVSLFPLTYNNSLIKYGLHATFARLAIYNVIVLTMLVKYKYYLL